MEKDIKKAVREDVWPSGGRTKSNLVWHDSRLKACRDKLFGSCNYISISIVRDTQGNRISVSYTNL